MSQSLTWKQKPLYFDGFFVYFNFYTQCGSWAVLYAFLPETNFLSSRRNPVSERSQGIWRLTFAVCGLLLFYLLMSVCLPVYLEHSCFHPESRRVFVADRNGVVYHFNCAENLTLSCQTKVIRPHLHLISCWQRALLLILIFNCAEVLCLCELELHWYFLFFVLFFVNQRTAERCYVKHSEATAVMVSSLYLAFFCARWTLQAYELNVSWRADSELAEGGGGSQSQKGENKRRRRMRTWRRVGGSRLRHMFSRRGLELVLPRLRLQTNHMRCTSSALLLQQQLVFAPDASAQTQCELAVLQSVK